MDIHRIYNYINSYFRILDFSCYNQVEAMMAIDANYPNMSNVTDFAEMAQYGNVVAEGWLGRVWLITWYIIAFTVISRNWSVKSAFIFTSITSAFFGILFRVIGIITDGDMFIVIVLALISIGFGFRD